VERLEPAVVGVAASCVLAGYDLEGGFGRHGEVRGRRGGEGGDDEGDDEDDDERKGGESRAGQGVPSCRVKSAGERRTRSSESELVNIV